MREVTIQIPTIEAEQNIEITVKINVKKKTLNYRVEIVEWEDEDKDKGNRVKTIRRVLQDYEKGWELINIGSPSDDGIPIMFRKKREKVEL